MTAGGRNRITALLRWLLPVVGLGLLQLVAIRAVDSTSDRGESDRWYPRTVGTTWIYTSRSNGQDSGTHVAEVVGDGRTTAGAAAVIESHWDNFLGTGPVTQVGYLGDRGRQLVLHGYRANGRYTAYDPPQPQWQASMAPGASFTWAGTYGLEDQRMTTTLEGREDVVVAGETERGCEHYSSTTTVRKDTGDVERTYEVWLCAGLGPVRTVESAPDFGALLEEELVGFRSSGRQLGALPPPSPAPDSAQPGDTPGVDDERTGAVPGGTVDLGRLAWSDGRKELVKFPPIGRDDLLVLAEHDGTVSVTRTTTGDVLWRVKVPGPVPVSPVMSGPNVIVAGADKTLSALDVSTGLPNWTVTLPDVPAVAPLAVGDTVVVAGQDRRVRSLGATDGSERWRAPTGDIPASPPALAGSLVVVGDKAGGVLALRLADGGVAWRTTLEGRLTAGPTTAGDRVLVVDKAGIVSAFDSASGDLEWSRYVELDISLPIVVAGDTVVLVPNGDRLVALDRRNGGRRWEALLGATTDGQPLVVGDSVLVTGRDDRLQRRSLADGSLVEAVPLTPPAPSTRIQGHLPLAWVGGRVVATFDLELPWPRTAMLAFGGGGGAGGVRLTGEVRSVPGPLAGMPRFAGPDLVVAGIDNAVSVVPPSGPPRTISRSDAKVTYAVPAGDAVLTTQGDQLVAVPLTGGDPRWRLPVGQPQAGSEPVVAGDTVLVPASGAGLVAASLATGAPRWVYPVAGAGAGSPIVLSDGDVLYGVGGLVRLDGQTGRPRWSFPGVTVYGPMAVGTGVVVLTAVTDRGSDLLAVDLATGQERWRRPLAPVLLVGPAASGATVVAVGATGDVVALDAATGRQLWTATLRTAPGGTPAILGDRVVLSEVGRDEDLLSRDTRLTVYDLRTGRYLGSQEPPGFAFTRGTFGASGDAVVTGTVAHGVAVMVLRPQ